MPVPELGSGVGAIAGQVRQIKPEQLVQLRGVNHITLRDRPRDHIEFYYTIWLPTGTQLATSWPQGPVGLPTMRRRDKELPRTKLLDVIERSAHSVIDIMGGGISTPTRNGARL